MSVVLSYNTKACRALLATATEVLRTMTSKRNPFTLGLVQMRCEPEPELNLEKAIIRIRQAAKDGAQIVCLQELFRSPYFCQREDAALFDLAEPIPGPSTERLTRI